MRTTAFAWGTHLARNSRVSQPQPNDILFNYCLILQLGESMIDTVATSRCVSFYEIILRQFSRELLFSSFDLKKNFCGFAGNSRGSSYETVNTCEEGHVNYNLFQW